MSDVGGVRMYFGTASGSARKALQKMEEPHVMLSIQSESAVPWDGIGHLFLDSGGFSLMFAQRDHPPTPEYLDEVDRYGADIFAVQDYPCEPEILERHGRTVAQHQAMTTERTAETIAAYEDGYLESDAEPVAVVQGWLLQQYLDHLRELRDQGCLTETVAIGSVCRRHQEDAIRDIVLAIRERIGPDRKLHAFGVKRSILGYEGVREALTSADTTAWYFRNYESRNEIDETWQSMCRLYLDYRRDLAKQAGILHAPRGDQTTLTESAGAGGGS